MLSEDSQQVHQALTIGSHNVLQPKITGLCHHTTYKLAQKVFPFFVALGLPEHWNDVNWKKVLMRACWYILKVLVLPSLCPVLVPLSNFKKWRN